MNYLKEGWFSEISSHIPNQILSLQVKEVLLDKQTDYQHMVIFDSVKFGRVLALDNLIQLTEADEFCYQEMISMLPLCSHARPRRVLVIGGGDGGVVRDVAKHPLVERVTLVDIDREVIEASKKYLPFVSVGLDNPKVEVLCEDGFAYLKKHKNEFDVIITDSTDPIGPGEVLFEKSYYELLHEALLPNGIICCQGECMHIDMKLISRVSRDLRAIFPAFRYAYTLVSTYPLGQIGFFLASKDPNQDFSPKLIVDDDKSLAEQFRYYTSKIHSASFVLPRFAHQEIYSDQ